MQPIEHLDLYPLQGLLAFSVQFHDLEDRVGLVAVFYRIQFTGFQLDVSGGGVGLVAIQALDLRHLHPAFLTVRDVDDTVSVGGKGADNRPGDFSDLKLHTSQRLAGHVIHLANLKASAGLVHKLHHGGGRQLQFYHLGFTAGDVSGVCLDLFNEVPPWHHILAGDSGHAVAAGAVLTNQTPVRMADQENGVRDGLPGDGVLLRDDEGVLRGVRQLDNTALRFPKRKLVNGIICQIAG